jgi:glycosyltransferase involved in cell wall biosynthesis
VSEELARAPGLRLLYLVSGLGPGGAELQARYLLTHLPARGVEVRLATFGGYEDELARVAAAGVAIHRLDPRPPGLWPARVLPALLGLLRRHRIRLVHSMLPTFDALAPCLRLIDPGLRVISSRRCLDEYLSPKELARLKRTGWLASRIVGNSSAVAASVTRLEGYAPPRLTAIPNGIDLPPALADGERGRARQAFDVEPGRFTVSLPSHFRRGKGHAWIPEVARRVREACPELLVLLAGDMEVSDQYRKVAAETRAEVARLGVDSCVRFLGPVRDMRALHAASDVSINLSDSEGMSNSVMEAMALGVPVVATAVGGNLEVLEDGVHGLHVPAHDPAAAAAALTRLVRDPGLRARLGAAARERIGGEYSIERMVTRYVRLYQEVLGG